MAVQVNPEQRRQMIAEAAYFRAERRGFTDGDPLADWIEAEAEIDATLREQVEHGALLERLEERLATAGEKLAALQKKVARMRTGARSDWQQEVEKLAKLRDAFEARLNDMREQGQHASGRLKDQAERIWQEISQVVAKTAREQKPRSDKS